MSYIKYMEQVELVSDAEEPVVTDNTYLQRVHIVNTIEFETGEPIYPDPPDPLEVDQEAEWSTSDFKPGGLISALSATFTGGSFQIEIYSRFRSTNSAGEYSYSSKFKEQENTPTLCSWTLPMDSVEIVFYTVCSDVLREDDVVYSATSFNEVVQPLEVSTPAAMKTNNVYRLKSTIAAYTADFTGGIQPVTSSAAFKYKKPGSNAIYYGPTYQQLGSEILYKSWKIPTDAHKVQFYTTARETGPTALKSETPWITAVQPMVTITEQPPLTVTDRLTTVVQVPCFATSNYYLYYQWQFKDGDGNWHDMSMSAVEYYFPRVSYKEFDGEEDCCWSYQRYSGEGPKFVRCKITDYVSRETTEVKYTNICELVKP